MISLILTGHGRIASGIQEAITQVFGAQADLHVVDFPDGMGTGDLEARLATVLGACTGETVFFTDLLGGSPFRIASTLAQARPGTEVIAGMNLSMFAEMLFERDDIATAAEFRQRAIEAGQGGITSLADRLARQQKRAEAVDGL
ncbi:PTS galactosamine/N-acetylgalactosamine transporter subunit IIA [Jeongeupia naejangsanensis]|uniref:PTS sugar transporter subunit IIA n=1 Tax=Jeongeupia naejangsanensis TaxID=613195 RepID=A0ABS2BNX0_9NEIS|nr:PTS galactosamine/N-acetylgalactosamine transporter subunit IIA [Jeongeupia naejangsanensis]MBM3116753.1 PTS sugar transporter subunit IIA [Jeongeupia naejangsanensis]